jgi:hypothetical protein
VAFFFFFDFFSCRKRRAITQKFPYTNNADENILNSSASGGKTLNQVNRTQSNKAKVISNSVRKLRFTNIGSRLVKNQQETKFESLTSATAAD